MGVKSRRKGANGELEFIKLLSDSFPSYEFQRNYDQAAKSGFDVKGLPKFGIEVKRYKRGRLYQLDWWEQVVEAVKPHRLLPMLAYRFDRTSEVFVFHLGIHPKLDHHTDLYPYHCNHQQTSQE